MPVVLTVSVDVPPGFVSEAGEKLKKPPAGGVGQAGEAAGVPLRVAVHALPLPLNPTVTVYVALPPERTGLGVCVLSVTVFGFESVNVICATSPEGFATAVAVNVTSRSRSSTTKV
jgi:hypothetical protein